LVDRWGTPLFFHAVGKGRYVLRSAGRIGGFGPRTIFSATPMAHFNAAPGWNLANERIGIASGLLTGY